MKQRTALVRVIGVLCMIRIREPVQLDLPEREQRYRESRLIRDRNTMLSVIAVTSVMLIVFLVLDILFAAHTQFWQLKIILRIISVCFSLGIIVLLWKQQLSVAAFDRTMFIWLMLIITHVYCDSALNAAAPATIVTWDVLIIFGIYTVAVFSQTRQVIAALYLSGGSAAVWLYLAQTGWSLWETLAVVAAYVFSNFFGMFLSDRFRESDRQQFLLLEQESTSRQQLAELNRTLARAVEEKSAALSQSELLMREMNHRVKNNLAIIQSLLNIQSREATDDHSRGALTESAARVQAVSRIHETLSGTFNLKEVSVADYFQELLTELALNFNIAEPACSVHLDIADITLDMDALIPVALVVNELATNAFKHAYTGRPGGEFSFSMKAAPGGAVAIRLADNGKGLPRGFDIRGGSSLGMNIIASLVRQVGAEIEFTSTPGEGTEFRIFIPGETGERK